MCGRSNLLTFVKKLDIGERYSIASMIYFIPYTLLFVPLSVPILRTALIYPRQIPANVVLRRLGARTLLTTCVFGWGFAQLGMTFVTTWGYLCLCRIFLGVFEVNPNYLLMFMTN